MQRKRSQWIETISGANAEHQIYLDESGINTNLTRHYAHAVHGKRAMITLESNTLESYSTFLLCKVLFLTTGLELGRCQY